MCTYSTISPAKHELCYVYLYTVEYISNFRCFRSFLEGFHWSLCYSTLASEALTLSIKFVLVYISTCMYTFINKYLRLHMCVRILAARILIMLYCIDRTIHPIVISFVCSFCYFFFHLLSFPHSPSLFVSAISCYMYTEYVSICIFHSPLV